MGELSTMKHKALQAKIILPLLTRRHGKSEFSGTCQGIGAPCDA